MDQEPKPVTSPASMFHDNIFPERQDFSLLLGGPLFQLLRRTHLAGDALELLLQRILLISLVAWLPLLVFSLAEGEARRRTLSVGRRSACPVSHCAPAADRCRAGRASAHAFRSAAIPGAQLDFPSALPRFI
jgi:hypothetical protein